MKKLLLISLTLFIIHNISYASFPVIEKTQTEIIETPRKIPLTDNAKILLLSLVPIPAAIIGAILFFAGVFSFKNKNFISIERSNTSHLSNIPLTMLVLVSICAAYVLLWLNLS